MPSRSFYNVCAPRLRCCFVVLMLRSLLFIWLDETIFTLAVFIAALLDGTLDMQFEITGVQRPQALYGERFSDIHDDLTLCLRRWLFDAFVHCM
jgi:hypothetical protein